MLRVMRQYFMATGDKEPLKTMDRFFRFQLETLPTQPLTGKACAGRRRTCCAPCGCTT